jgi:hypothetical protein
MVREVRFSFVRGVRVHWVWIQWGQSWRRVWARPKTHLARVNAHAAMSTVRAFCARQGGWNPLSCHLIPDWNRAAQKGMGSPKTADEADDSCRHKSEREFVMCLSNSAVLLSTDAPRLEAGEEVLRPGGAAQASSAPLWMCESPLRQRDGSGTSSSSQPSSMSNCSSSGRPATRHCMSACSVVGRIVSCSSRNARFWS